MFKEVIMKTPIFTDIFRSSVTQGGFDQFYDDDSLFMSMVVLLAPRDKNFKIESSISRCANDVSFKDYEWDKNTNEHIYRIKWFETPLNNVNELKNVKALTSVEEFVTHETGCTVKVRISEEHNTVCIFMEKLTSEVYHFMISFMSLYFKIFKEKPLTKAETDFMRTLSLKNALNFRRQFDSIIKSSEFTRILLKNQLSGLGEKLYKIKITAAEKKVKESENALEAIMSRYKELFEIYQEAKYRCEGIKAVAGEANDTAELEEYLVNNKNLINIAVNGNTLSFIVKTYLFPYLTDDWKNIDRRGSYYIDNGSMTGQEIKLLLNSILSENHTLKLKMCARFDLDYFGADAHSKQYFNYVVANSELVDYLPNTHLNNFDCFGTNLDDVLESLKTGDVISAVECCINITKRININERQTFSSFITKLTSFTGRCIETEDGISMTPKEAVEYLKEHKNGKEN